MKQVTRIGVYGIAIKEDAILLIAKGDTGAYKGKWDLPGGGIEFSETPELALQREFLEEVGMRFKKMELFHNISHTGDIMHANPPMRFHHMGMLYKVFDTTLIPEIVPEHKFVWQPFTTIDFRTLTPFAAYVAKLLV